MKSLPMSPVLFLLLATFSAVTATPSVAPGRPSGYTASTHEYESSALVEFIIPRDVPFEKMREYMDRQMEDILAEENLRQAIQELMPSAFDAIRQPFFEEAKNELKVEYLKGTDLVQIKVRSRDKRFSCDLANQLAERYLRNHKPKNGAKGAIIHEKAVIGVPVEKKKPDVEQDAPEQPPPAPPPK
ncbi:MAG: hypothetical protein NTW21_12865 [Verrucomicrobia bacterium]|nr:hypothetical protein [Verrucomicrobiota bacterium]